MGARGALGLMHRPSLPVRPSGGSLAGRRFSFGSPRVAVTTAAESAARDAAAIASGIPSRALMRNSQSHGWSVSAEAASDW